MEGKLRRLPIVVLSVWFASGCGSSLPTTPSSTPSPTPAPTPAPTPIPPGSILPIPLGPDNLITLRASATLPARLPDPTIGRYLLEIISRSTSGLRCQSVPEHAKRRSYTADINPFRDYYAVSLYEATFLKDGARVGFGCSDSRLNMGGVCHQFILRHDGDDAVSVNMVPEDEWRGSEIWEVLLQEGRLLQLHGHATGSVRNGRIEATGIGGVWYGNGLPASDYSACGPGEMTWTFTRQ